MPVAMVSLPALSRSDVPATGASSAMAAAVIEPATAMAAAMAYPFNFIMQFLQQRAATPYFFVAAFSVIFAVSKTIFPLRTT